MLTVKRKGRKGRETFHASEWKPGMYLENKLNGRYSQDVTETESYASAVQSVGEKLGTIRQRYGR